MWAFLALCIVVYFLIGGTGSDYFKRSYQQLFHPVPVFNHLVIEHNGTAKRLIPGQTLHLQPNDTLKIVKMDTSVLFNRGIRLFSGGFDVNALKEEMAISKLLPGEEIFHRYTYTITVKYRNEYIGEVALAISPSVDDWLERANRFIDAKKRVAFLKKAVKETRGDLQLKIKLADEYLALKMWKRAANTIEDILKQTEDSNLLEKLVDTYEQLRDYDRVAATLRKILIKTPDDLETRLRLAEVLEKEGKLKEAIKEYATILPKLTKDEKMVFMKNLGYLSFQAGEKKEALEWYLKAATYDKTDPNLYYNIGSLYDELNKPQQSEKYLRMAIDLKKDDLEGRLRLGQSLMNKGEAKDAKRYVQEVLKKDPNNMEALVLLASIVEKGNDKKALRDVYEKILSQDGKNTTILFNLGALEGEEGNLEKATSYLKRVVKIDPKDLQAREALFDLYQKQEMNALAFNEAVIVIELAPKKISYYRYLFSYLMDKSEFEQLVQYMRKGAQANPKSFELRQYLILAYLKSEKNDLAIKEMEEAIKLRPNDTAILHQLAKLKEDSGDLESALVLYKKILDISADDEKAQKAYFRLRLQLLNKGR